MTDACELRPLCFHARARSYASECASASQTDARRGNAESALSAQPRRRRRFRNRIAEQHHRRRESWFRKGRVARAQLSCRRNPAPGEQNRSHRESRARGYPVRWSRKSPDPCISASRPWRSSAGAEAVSPTRRLREDRRDRVVANSIARPGACGWANAIVRAVRGLACEDGRHAQALSAYLAWASHGRALPLPRSSARPTDRRCGAAVSRRAAVAGRPPENYSWSTGAMWLHLMGAALAATGSRRQRGPRAGGCPRRGAHACRADRQRLQRPRQGQARLRRAMPTDCGR